MSIIRKAPAGDATIPAGQGTPRTPAAPDARARRVPTTRQAPTTRQVLSAGLVVALLAAGGVVVGAQLRQSPAAQAQAPAAPNQRMVRAEAVLRDTTGKEVGKVRFVGFEGNEGPVRVSVTASGLPPGFHGFHLHARALCDRPSFAGAGGHLNPDPAKAHPGHAGDMPSLFVAGDGSARASFMTDSFNFVQLRDADGSAVIVHAAADNFANIPGRYRSAAPAAPPAGPDAETLETGDAGGRIACGLVPPDPSAAPVPAVRQLL